MKRDYTWAKQMVLEHIAVIEKDPYWCKAAKSAGQVMYGSWCSGFADNDSDIDLVLCVDREIYDKALVKAERHGVIARGEIVRFNTGTRDSGYGWLLTGRLRTYDDLENELDKDLGVALWMYTESDIISDPSGRFAQIIDHWTREFDRRRRTMISERFARVFRCYVWIHGSASRMRQRSLSLIVASFVREVLQIRCLIVGVPFPYDKWLVPWTEKQCCTDAAFSADVKLALSGRASKWSRQGAIDRLYSETTRLLEASDLALERVVKHPERWYGI